jgi:hypothetical protein
VNQGLGVLSVLRDEAPNLGRFFNLLEALEEERSIWGRIFFSFYENDSSDGTPERLASWLTDRNGSLITETYWEPKGVGRQLARTQRLASARNSALAPLIAQDLAWLLVIDADLKIDLGHVRSLYDMAQYNPHASMLCASAIQNVPDVFGESQWSYYDSWALRDLQGSGGITFAANPFRQQSDRWRWMAGLPVSVAAAFGGMALLPMDVVRRYQLHWQGDHGCEHWAFCAGARRGGAVLACPTVQPLVIHRDPPQWTHRYAVQVRSQLTA